MGFGFLLGCRIGVRFGKLLAANDFGLVVKPESPENRLKLNPIVSNVDRFGKTAPETLASQRFRNPAVAVLPVCGGIDTLSLERGA